MIPNIQITDKGVQAPSREAVTDGLWNLLVAAFGPQLTRDDRTAQGQLVTSLTKVITDRDNATIELANNFDPRYAVGVYQEALAQVYFIDKKKEINSTVDLKFTGQIGALIPEGFVCIDSQSNQWLTDSEVTIGFGGTVTVKSTCATTGPIAASADTITDMQQSIVGVDRVTNPAPAAAGSFAESRTDFETRRYDSVAQNSWGMNASVLGAVNNIQGVIDCYVIDNPKDVSITVGPTNYPMIRNSLLVSVVGGDDDEIAKRVMIKGGTTCAFVGNTEVTYKDTDSYNVFPPEYEVKFLRPDHKDIYFRLSFIDLSAISYNKTEEIKDKLIDSLSTGIRRLRISSKVIGPSYMCVIGADDGLLKIEVSKDNSVWFDIVEFGVDEYPVINKGNINLVQA